MGESTREKFNQECHNTFVDKVMVNEIMASRSLIDPSPPNPHLDYEIQVKEESFNLFHREETISPVIFHNNMKREIDDFDTDLGLMSNQKDEEESDEETIATFITAAGQQLALYAVEDSDEIFAVAVYDESGEPPTDFQFLMKSDVEKLIGEGAVRTVKKTSQFKKQIYTTDDINSMNSIDTNSQLSPQNSSDKLIQEFTPAKILKTEKSFSEDEELHFNDIKDIDQTTTKPSIDFEPYKASQLIYDNVSSENVFLVVQEDPVIPDIHDEPIEETIDEEIIDKSTVQYILPTDPPDFSDLTLNDIEELLKKDKSKLNIKKNSPKPNKTIPSIIKDNMRDKINIKFGESIINDLNSSHETIDNFNNNYDYFNDSTISEENEDINIDNSTIDKEDVSSNIEKTVDILRIKRPRKQQLTTVNRADTEIIIQPAILSQSDDDNIPDNRWKIPKKRGRRKKKKDGRLNIKRKPYKMRRKTKSSKKKYRIEVIDIDVDVNREIITLEDGKEKGSSDKENEVIMVGDSDDDDVDKDEEIEIDDDNDDDSDYDDRAERKSRRRGSLRSSIRHLGDIFECEGCGKGFRTKRTLDIHLRVCGESRIEERRCLRSSRIGKLSDDDKGSKGKKGRGGREYECKNCHERFEVVVALARHVRLMHSKRKSNRSESEEEFEGRKGRKRGRVEVEIEGRRSTRFGEKKGELEGRKKGKERFRGGDKRRSMGKNCCKDCGKWFTGLAGLLAHSLQHTTKKIVSEKSKIQRCRRCKKVFRSQFLYIRHLRMHSSTSKLRKGHLEVIKQSSGGETSLKKRGKSRKL